MSAALEKGLYSVLTGTSPQTSAAGRVYPRLPQNAVFPAVRYQRISTERQRGLAAGRVGVTATLLQVDCLGQSYSAAKDLADEVRAVLDEYVGTWGTLTCRFCVLETEIDSEYIDGDETRHWVVQRYRIYSNMD